MTNRITGFRLRARIVISVLLAAAFLQPALGGASRGNVELHVKAAYLFNFGRYVSWPAQSGDVVIGILGHDPIADVLERTVMGKKINGRVYRVKIFSSPEQIDHCDILFLPRTEARRMQPDLTTLSGKPMLTVSDLENFSNEGGMVEFLLIDDTLKFDINLGAAEKSGLKISSELLGVAHEIKGRRR